MCKVYKSLKIYSIKENKDKKSGLWEFISKDTETNVQNVTMI